MNHEHWERNFLRYFYGELSAEEKQEFERHLEQCLVCRKEMEGLKALSEKISEFNVPEPGRDTIERIVAKAEAEKDSAGEIRGWLKTRRMVWSFAGAIVAMIVIGLSLLMVLEKPEEIDYEGLEVSQTIGVIEQELPADDASGFVALVYEDENLFDGLEDELAALGSESESEQNWFEEMEQELFEIEELGNGIFEI